MGTPWTTLLVDLQNLRISHYLCIYTILHSIFYGAMMQTDVPGSFSRQSFRRGPLGLNLKRGGRKMKKIDALKEITAMWTWLYKHPAHDRTFYEAHVAKLDQPWKNDCPICNQEADTCPDCPMKWEEQKGTFCTDPESPLQKWKETSTDNPDYRTLYSGEIIAIANKAMKRLTAS
jgi:hypothetical protein